MDPVDEPDSASAASVPTGIHHALLRVGGPCAVEIDLTAMGRRPA